MSFSVPYTLAVSAGYKLNLANYGENVYDAQIAQLPSYFKDAIMTRSKYQEDLYHIHTNCLVTCNGFVHNTKYLDGKLYVMDAGKNLHKSRVNQVGIIDFTKLNKPLEIQRIDPEKIFNDSGFDLYQRANIKFDKPVPVCLFIFMGYILTEQDGFFERKSDSEFVIYPKKLGLMAKIHELNRTRDIFKDLGIDTLETNENTFRFEQAVSDEVIKKMLCLDNSFLVGLPDHTIEYGFHYMDYSSIPCLYRCPSFPIYPLFAGEGKVIEYKVRPGNTERWNVLTVDSFYQNLTKDYTPEQALRLHSHNSLVGHTYDISSAFMLEMKLTEIKK